MTVRRKLPSPEVNERRIEAWQPRSIEVARKMEMMFTERLLSILDELNTEIYKYLKLNGLRVPDHISDRYFKTLDDDIPF